MYRVYVGIKNQISAWFYCVLLYYSYLIVFVIYLARAKAVNTGFHDGDDGTDGQCYSFADASRRVKLGGGGYSGDEWTPDDAECI